MEIILLRLTRIADYGVLLMASMAASERPRLTAADLAQQTQIPAPTVSKILQKLLAGKMLNSVRGAHGGYALMRAAGEISVADILQCLEGDLALTECTQHEFRCDQQAVCTIGRNWQGINRSIARVLQKITLADMMAEAFEPEFCLVTQPHKSMMTIQAEAPASNCHQCTGSAL